MSDTKAMNVHQRIAQVMKAVTYVQKERKNGMKYTIVTHDKVTGLARTPLLEAGVIYYPVRCDNVINGNRVECSMTVRFCNIDDPADHIDVPTFGFGIDAQDKGPGKAMSYAVKYALLKTLGLETGDDPENDSIDYQEAPPPDFGAIRDRIKGEVAKASDADAWRRVRDSNSEALNTLKANDPPKYNECRKAFTDRASAIKASVSDEIPDEIPYDNAPPPDVPDIPEEALQ